MVAGVSCDLSIENEIGGWMDWENQKKVSGSQGGKVVVVVVVCMPFYSIGTMHFERLMTRLAALAVVRTLNVLKVFGYLAGNPAYQTRLFGRWTREISWIGLGSNTVHVSSMFQL